MSATFPTADLASNRPVRPDLDVHLTQSQRTTVGSLARLARIVGISSLVLSVLTLGFALYASQWALLLQAGILFVVGVLNLGVATAFRDAANAAQREIGAVFEALAQLRTLYLFQVGAMIVLLVFIVVLVLGVIALLAMR